MFMKQVRPVKPVHRVISIPINGTVEGRMSVYVLTYEW